MKNALQSINGRLARRIVTYVILISTIFSIATSGIQIYSEFQRDISSVHAGLEQIEKTHLSNITSRLWVLDTDELTTTLNSLLSLPAIQYIAVYENESLLATVGTDTDQNIITKSYPLIYTLNNKNNLIGNLIVKASLDKVYQHIIDRAIVIIVSNTIKTFIVALLILLIFYRFVTRHLSSISEFSQNHNPLLKHQPLTLDRNNKKRDELDTVIDSINNMHLRLNQQVTEINQQKQYLSQTLNSIGDAVITTDMQGSITSMNPVAEKLTGWSADEAQKQTLKTIFPIINATTLTPIENPIDKVIASGETVFLSNHTTLISKQGTEYQIADSAAPIRDDEGNILGMVLVFNDISEQYQLREAAAKSRRNLQAIMDHSPTVIYLKDKNGHFIFLNQQFEKHFNISSDDLIGKTVHDILPRDIADKIQRYDDEVWATGAALEFEEVVPHKDADHTYLTSKFPLLNDDGKVYAVCSISTDITEKQRTEETIRKIADGVSSQIGEAFFQSLTQHLAKIFSAEYTFIGLLDKHKPNKINTVSLCIHGEIVDNMSYELEHTPCDHVISGHCDSIQAFSSDIQQLFPKDTMLLEMAAESYVGAPLVASNGKPIGLIVVMDNKPMVNSKLVATILQIFATRAIAELERIKAEEALRHSQKMDALGKLTGGIAHDYNNMLGVVLGYTELLLSNLDIKDQPKLVKYVNEINRAGLRSAKLTEKLLAFSREKTSNSELININTVLLDEQHLLEKTLTARITLTLDLAENLWATQLDGNDLQDAILNMAINAMHAIDGNGQLTIQTSNKIIDDLTAQQLQINTGDYVLLSISDTGCGMDEQIQDKIFDPFYSTKGDSGTGLGLSQVYGFVERSNGTINVRSEPNQGTQLDIYFPRQIEKINGTLAAESRDIRQSNGQESILVVDDELALLELTAEILRQNGYQVYSADNARQALEIIENESIDLLFSDVIMPEMDGYELADIVQQKYPNIKIQLASGYYDKQQLNMIDESLRKYLLPKPYNSQILLQTIKNLLN